MAESQLRKGALELVILGLLQSEPTYGGEILKRLQNNAGLDISQGTVYPLLNRLRKSELLVTKWEESPSGPPRKIYALSDAGKERLNLLTHEWDQLNQAVLLVTKGMQS